MTTETEWFQLAEANAPMRMLDILRQRGIGQTPGGRRKLRLLAVASVRQIWRMLNQDCRAALETAERYAEHLIGERERMDAEAVVNSARPLSDLTLARNVAAEAVLAALWPSAMKAAELAFLRTFEAYGCEPGPYTIRPYYAIDDRVAQIKRIQSSLLQDVFGNLFHPSAVEPSWLSWNNDTVLNLAQTIYDERAFDRLPILGDALEEAGCTDSDILNHCRGPGPHVRGCWALDLLLCK